MVEAGTGEGKQKGLASIPREVPSNISAVVASMHTSALCIARNCPLCGLNWFLCPDYGGAWLRSTYQTCLCRRTGISHVQVFITGEYHASGRDVPA